MSAKCLARVKYSRCEVSVSQTKCIDLQCTMQKDDLFLTEKKASSQRLLQYLRGLASVWNAIVHTLLSAFVIAKNVMYAFVDFGAYLLLKISHFSRLALYVKSASTPIATTSSKIKSDMSTSISVKPQSRLGDDEQQRLLSYLSRDEPYLPIAFCGASRCEKTHRKADYSRS